MNRLTDLQRDVKNVQDTVLTDLDADERVRMFLKAAAEDREDRIEMLRESAPRYEYKMRDLEFTEGTKEVYILSMLANHALERLHTATLMYEAGRDKHVALVLLNEALERLSQGHFTVDEHGNADAPASWPHPHRWMDDADTARLAGKYRELWGENDLPLTTDIEERVTPYFAELATDGLLGYRHNTESLENGLSYIALSEQKLIETVVSFYVAFHTFRRLGEEHLDITLDELLQATQAERDRFDTDTVDEETCRDLLERKQYLLDAYERNMKVFADAMEDIDPDDVEGAYPDGDYTALFDLDAEVEDAVEEMLTELDYVV